MLTSERNIQTIAAAPKFEQNGPPDGEGADRKKDSTRTTSLR